MKKIYLSVLALLIGSISFGQVLQQQLNFRTVDLAQEDNSKNTPNNDKAAGDIIWDNYFDTPAEVAEWTADNNSQAAPFGWTIDAISNGWWAAAAGILSTSGGSYAELSNGNPNAPIPTQALNVVYTLTSNPIDLIALGGVGSENSILEFEQYGARFNDLQEIQLSTDGITFITIGDNFNHPVLSATGGAPYPNPETKSINLFPFLNATTAQTVQIRFRWTTNFPAQAANPNVWITYGWYIDDVKIVEPEANDIIANEGYAGFNLYQYSRIPFDHVAPADFSVFAINNGTAIQTNTFLEVKDNGVVVSTGTPANLAIAATDSIFSSSYTTPIPTIGIPHVFSLEIKSDSIDVTPANNIISFPPFEYTTSMYALDDFGANGVGNGGGENGAVAGQFEFEAGNYFDAVINDVAGSIEVVVGTNTIAGTLIDVVLYQVNATGTFTEISRSAPYVTTVLDTGNAVRLNLTTFPNPALIAGTTYFAAVHSMFTEFFYGTSGNSPNGAGTANQASLIFYPNMTTPTSSFFTTQTPMVRLITEPAPDITWTNQPANTTIECDASNLPANTGTATATTACVTPSLNITSTDVTVAGACVNESVITRTWTATDNCGNSETFDQTITVEDNTNPVITCPANQTQIAANGTDTVLIDYTGMATVSDNCSNNANITVTQSPAIGSTQNVGIVTITLTATDECGNTANCNFDVDITNSTGIADNTRANISISPNPNNGLFTIDLGSKMKGNITIQVYNLLGEVVYNKENENANTAYVLDLKHVEKGIYYISIKGEQESIVKKIMIM